MSSLNDEDAQQSKISKIIEAQRLIKTKKFKSWRLSSYFGPIPNKPEGNVQQLGFCCYAITHNVKQSGKPDLSSGCGTQVILGTDTSVIVWSDSTESGLDKKIKQTFKTFTWGNN